MNFEPVLRQIDDEIERLRQIRVIVQSLDGPAFRVPRLTKVVLEAAEAETVLPQLRVLPPKLKREYQRRQRSGAPMPRALGPAPSARPVFVPRNTSVEAAEITPPLPKPSAAREDLEAVVRRNLLASAPISASPAG